jgi:hypothetical protein
VSEDPSAEHKRHEWRKRSSPRQAAPCSVNTKWRSRRNQQAAFDPYKNFKFR